MLRTKLKVNKTEKTMSAIMKPYLSRGVYSEVPDVTNAMVRVTESDIVMFNDYILNFNSHI